MKLELRGIEQRFGDANALAHIDLTLDGRKIVGLLGRNGSGKTTLLSIIAGFRKPTAGVVLIDGEPVFENPLAMRQIALIREGGDTVDESEKVEESLRVAAWLRSNWDDDLARSLLEKFEVNPRSQLDQLSRGKRSAVGVALGLAARADLTMFDETYLGLDAPSRYHFYDAVLQSYIDHPRMFILSSHLISEIARILEEIVMIDRGSVLVHDSAEHLGAQGVTITGTEAAVGQFVADAKVLGQRRLCGILSVAAYGAQSSFDRQQAAALGLEITPLELQDLFIHLTDHTEQIS